MHTIKVNITALKTRTLIIGYVGENERTQVRFECEGIFDEYPHAAPSLAIKPPVGDVYPVVVSRDEDDVVWDVSNADLQHEGSGELQLTFVKDGAVAKTVIGKLQISRSLLVTGEQPDVIQTWYDAATEKLAEVDAQIVELEGMVDTATDAATRAEQSESNATTAAANAATSAATASTKAAEAQASANTATAKAAEAALSATQASNSAVSAADSESGATAKAAEAAQSARTAAQKAEQITEAAQIATGKAEEASASATAAQTSATNAASSATAAQAAQTAAQASETAASTSATQAAQSAQNANTAAQTATQKAAEATQSATNAAASATSAATSAETASTKAGEAAQSAQAVTETAEQLADSLEQIAQNTQDIAELDERKANIDGYYPDMTVGNAEQLNSSKYVENSEPYTFRTSGGSSDIGNREYLDAVVGGTLAWNQAVRDEASENSTDFADVVTVTDAVEDAAGVKVKIEPVQDLHGYDHPWPAGGGKNLWGDIVMANDMARTVGASVNTTNKNVSITTGAGSPEANMTDGVVFKENTQYTFIFDGVVSSYGNLMFSYTDGTNDRSLGRYFSVGANVSAPGKTVAGLHKRSYSNTTIIYYEKAGLFEGDLTASQFSPYSNICPITGWDGVKVSRTGKNLIDKSDGKIGNGGRGISFGAVSYSDITPDGSLVLPAGDYTISLSGVNSTVAEGFYIRNTTGQVKVAYSTKTCSFSLSEKQAIRIAIIISTANFVSWDNYDIQLELGDIATDYEPYSGTSLPISWQTEAGTVYGGELTVNADGSGSLVVDRAVIASYNGESLPGEWISDRDVYTSGATPTTGAQVVYKLSTPITYTLTASQIHTLLGQNNIWSDAGQTALTYTGTDEHLVLESGKKYLSRISGTDSMLLGSGQEITAAKGTDNVFDLTQMFGTAVADYVYGQGAAFFRKWFPNAKYPYNAGELLSVEGLQSHDTVGFNLWDEKWEVGNISDSTGEIVTDNTRIRSKNFIPVLPGAEYYFYNGSNAEMGVFAYDANKDYIGAWRRATGWSSGAGTNNVTGQVITMPSNAHFILFRCVPAYGTTYKHDICISLSHNGSRNGEYEPYEKHSYPLDSTVILRGIPKVGTNGVYWDGDRYLPDGTVTRRYGIVDMGTLVWSQKAGATNAFYSWSLRNLTRKYPITEIANVSCPKYSVDTFYNVYGTLHIDKAISIGTSGEIGVHDTSYSTKEEMQAAMQGVMLVYELATPTTETAQPYHSTQWVSDWGTEEFVSTGIVPVGHETRYPANLRDKLQHLPDAASGNGSYLITQTDGQMTLTPFPAPPSTAGNYVLKATVTGGVATYTWEVAT